MKKPGAYREQERNGNVTVLDPQRRNNGSTKQLERSKGAVYSSAKPVELYPFDDEYMERLRSGDLATRDHFTDYFGKLLRIKLRSRKLPFHVIKDVQQETFCRVWDAVGKGEVRQPDRLGAYVNSVCNNILLEHYRQLAREQHLDLEAVDGPDTTADLEARTITDEESQRVHAIIGQLSRRERAVLRAMLLERDKDEVCHELKVSRDYLRVLTHRAAENFRDRY